MIHRNLRSLTSCLIAICLIGSAHTCEAAIIDSGTFLTIDDTGNPSNGLQYLDSIFSDNRTEADAVANAVLNGFANARVATPTEFDDLFTAAGITYNGGGNTAADGFTAGGTVILSNSGNYDGGTLFGLLGETNGSEALFWTDPFNGANRDFVRVAAGYSSIGSTGLAPAHASLGWLLVNEASSSAVPEPSSALLLGFASLIGIAAYRRKRKS